MSWGGIGFSVAKTERNRALVREHAWRGRSFADLAREHGVTRERVRQLVTTELKRCRHGCGLHVGAFKYCPLHGLGHTGGS